MKVDTPVVRPGDLLVLDVRYHKPTNADALIGFNIVTEGVLYATPAMLVALPIGEHKLKLPVAVPWALPPGRYVCYMVKRRITDVDFPWPLFGQNEPLLAASESFQVVKP